MLCILLKLMVFGVLNAKGKNSKMYIKTNATKSEILVKRIVKSKCINSLSYKRSIEETHQQNLLQLDKLEFGVLKGPDETVF